MRKTILALSLAAAACGSEPAPAPRQADAKEAADAASYQQQILALPEPQRLAVFANAIRDSGQDCQHVNSAASAGTYRGRPVWRATCRGGGVWTIVIAGEGGAQVLDARQVQLVTDDMANASTAQ